MIIDFETPREDQYILTKLSQTFLQMFLNRILYKNIFW